MTFYLLTWTYFNDVNGGRNILINSQPSQNPFYEQRQEKMKQNLERQKNIEKEKNSNDSETSAKMRYQI